MMYDYQASAVKQCHIYWSDWQ